MECVIRHLRQVAIQTIINAIHLFFFSMNFRHATYPTLLQLMLHCKMLTIWVLTSPSPGKPLTDDVI